MEKDDAYLKKKLELEVNNPNFWNRFDKGKIEEKLSRGGETIVFIFDNAGEDVLDFILIHQMLKLGNRIILAGKSKPAINDTTSEDIIELVKNKQIKNLLKGYEGQIEIIATGTQVQGTDLMRISPEFNRAWQNADLLIFKGQGNYYTIHGWNLTKDSLFLLKVKWPPEVRNRYSIGDNVAEFVSAHESQTTNTDLFVEQSI